MPDYTTAKKENSNTLSFENTQIAFAHQSDKSLKRSYWLYKAINNNYLVKIGPSLTKLALNLRLPISGLIKKTIFKQFCGGESIGECTPTINNLAVYNIGTILDYSVEGAEQESNFEETAEEILKTINAAKLSPEKIPFTVFKITGLARFSLLEKVSSETELPDVEQYELHKVTDRIEKVCQAAHENNVRIMIDAEESWIQNAIDKFALAMMRKFNKQKTIIFNTYQLYRHDKLFSLIADAEYARDNQFYLGAKLVRGAYMEKERKRAEEMNYKSPIQVSKEATDTDYDQAVQFCLTFYKSISFVAGTHNELSCKCLAQTMDEQNINHSEQNIYFSQLLGMSDNLSFNLSNAGYNVAKYVPYGPVKAVLPYLFRRAEENTAIAGQAGRELKLIAKELKRRKFQ